MDAGRRHRQRAQLDNLIRSKSPSRSASTSLLNQFMLVTGKIALVCYDCGHLSLVYVGDSACAGSFKWSAVAT